MNVGGSNTKAVEIGRDDDFIDVFTIDKNIVHRMDIGMDIDAEAEAGVALRVEVYQQHLFFKAREGCGQINGSCRLGHTAFLVDESDDLETKRGGGLLGLAPSGILVG